MATFAGIDKDCADSASIDDDTHSVEWDYVPQRPSELKMAKGSVVRVIKRRNRCIVQKSFAS